MMAQKGSRGAAPLSLNLGIRMTYVANATPRPIYFPVAGLTPEPD